MATLSVRFYRSATGHEPVREWLLSLDRELRRSIGSDIKTVEIGWPLGMPLVRKMAGCASPLPPVENAILGVDMPKAGGRDDYVRGAVNSGKVAPVYTQDSAATYALSLANCLIRRPAGSNAAQAGEMAEIIPL